VRERLSGTATLARTVVGAARETELTDLAAGIAYYAFVSLVPLVLVALATATTLGGPALSDRLLSALDRVLTPEGRELVRTALVADAGRRTATVAGLLALTWSGLKVFRGLDRAFARVYDTPGGASFVESVRDAVVALAGVGLGVVAVAAVGAVAAALSRTVGLGPALAVPVGAAGLVATLTAVFLPLYYVLPDAETDLRGVVPGAVLAAVGWALLGAGFQLYAAVAGSFALYGALGAALLLVTWLYFGAVVLLLGAVVNAALAGRYDDGDDGDETAGDRQLQQAGGRRFAPRMDDGAADREDDAGPGDGDGPTEFDPEGRADSDERAAAVRTELERLWEELEDLEGDLDERTVSRSTFESEMKRYVRARIRRGHARGWGPYLVLLYGTLMTLGAFFYLRGLWAILAMVVVWLSTLGLYTLMVLVGAGVGGLNALARLRHLR
jgi:YihY family inner membrane protein